MNIVSESNVDVPLAITVMNPNRGMCNSIAIPEINIHVFVDDSQNKGYLPELFGWHPCF